MCTFHLAYFKFGCQFTRVRPHQGRTVRYIPLQEYGIQILLLKIVDFAVHFVGKIAFQTFTKQGQLQSATKFDTVAVLTPHSTTQRQQGASQFIKLICNEIPGWFCSKKQGMTKKDPSYSLLLFQQLRNDFSPEWKLSLFTILIMTKCGLLVEELGHGIL